MGCGELVVAEARFCPHCGTRQIPDRPMPVNVLHEETEQLGRSATGWMLAVLVAAGLFLLAAGVVVGRLAASADDSDGGAVEGDAADRMDAYAPIADAWARKHDHVADEAGSDDPNGVAAAAADARIWIDVSRGDLGELSAGAEGAAAPLYGNLVAIFDERSAVLADLEADATAGGGEDEGLAALEELERRSDATTCEIAEVMRAEGDDPDEHISAGMSVAC